MSPKTVIFTICCLFTVQVIRADPKSPRSIIDDAHDAFNDYYALSREIVAGLNEDLLNAERNQNEQLQKIQQSTLDSLNQKLDEVEAKIQQIEANLKEVSITDCTVGYADGIEALRTRLTSRAAKCTELTSAAIANLVNETFGDISWQQNSLMSCYARSLAQCRSHAVDDSCYEFVIDNIARVKENMVLDFELIKVNFLNKITSLKLPCQELIEFEISIYPDLNLQTITECAENDIRNTRPYTCPDRYSL